MSVFMLLAGMSHISWPTLKYVSVEQYTYIVFNNAKLQSKPHFTTTVVMSGENIAGFVFASQACLITTRALVHVSVIS